MSQQTDKYDSMFNCLVDDDGTVIVRGHWHQSESRQVEYLETVKSLGQALGKIEEVAVKGLREGSRNQKPSLFQR